MDRTVMLIELNNIMREVLDDPSVKLTADSTANDVDGWDSMSYITFVVEVERRFGVEFKIAEIEEMRSVGDVVAMIVAKRKA